MPSLAAYAQRVRYPNGGCSGAFLAPFSREDMCRSADLIIMDDGTTTKPAWCDDGGSARLSVAWNGRFWGTAGVWAGRVSMDDGYLGDHKVWSRDERRANHLYRGELLLLLRGNDESGYHMLHALGLEDVNRYLARSVLLMAKSIEEPFGWG